LTNSVINMYDNIDLIGKKDKEEQDKIALLVNPAPNGLLPNTKPELFTAQLEPKLKAYRALAKVYDNFNLLTDSKYSDKTKETTESLQSALSSIQQIPSLPKEVSGLLPSITQGITKTIQAKKVKTHNQIILPITQAFFELWKKDAGLWKEVMAMYTNSEVESFGSILPATFDADKISRLMAEEPYKDPNILISLYKIKYRNKLISIQMEFNKQIDNITSAFSKLVDSHTELSKDKPNTSDLTSLLGDINSTVQKLKNK